MLKLKEIKKLSKFGVISALLPIMAFAQTTFFDILVTVSDLLAIVIPILLVIATIIFIYGLITYILNVGNAEKQKEARSLMIWGIVLLFVIVAVWGLVGVVGRTFNVENANIPEGPLPPVIQ